MSEVLRGNDGKGVVIVGKKGDKGVRATVARLVLLALAEHANKKGVAYPSTATIAEETGLSRAAVVRAMQLLRDQKLIEPVSKTRGGRVGSSFTVLPNCLISEPVTGSVETSTGSEGTSTGSVDASTDSDVSHEPSLTLLNRHEPGRYEPDFDALREFVAGQRLNEAIR